MTLHPARPRILAIDNAPEVLELYEVLLGEEGYTVIPIPCEAAGPAILLHAQPDVILLDCFIGCRCTGWDMLDMLRRDSRLNRIPVVICTTDVRLVQDEGDWLRSEGIAVVQKPFDLQALLSTVDAACSLPDPVDG